MSYQSEIRHIVFNNPRNDDQFTHVDLIKELCVNSAEGSDIFISISHFARIDLVHAMVNAAARGVNVNLLLRTEDGEAAAEHFETVHPDHLVVITRAQGCFAEWMHNKLYLFSSTKVYGSAINHVSVTGSGTLSLDTEDKHENLVVVADKELYDGLRQHWINMQGVAHLNDSTHGEPDPQDVYSTSQRIKAYLFPRVDGDPIRRVINKMGGGHHPDGRRPELHIAMARWSGSNRSLEIVRSIESAVARGVDADIIFREDADSEVVARLSHQESNGGRLWLSRSNFDDDSYIHSKYFMFSGFYDGSNEWERYVWTGSDNWTGAGNDEVVFKIRDSHAYLMYKENHQVIKTFCTPVEVIRTLG